MADHHDHSNDHYVHGEMDIHQHQHSYELFASLTKWCSLHIATVLIFLVILTCTKLGFFTAAIAAIVVSVLGFLMLKKKPGASH